ncbi:MAG: glycosyltransferase family 39 protein [Planctomycetes bacterium]|nr:glycosyltransferase family 39 protein [Planctomycetota bacterium]
MNEQIHGDSSACGQADRRAVNIRPLSVSDWLRTLWNHVLFPGESTRSEAWRWTPCFVVLVLSAGLLYPCLSFYLFEPDEGRYAQIPREMLTRGDWIVPWLQSEPYLDKPPLFYWLVMASFTVFGFHDWSARLVPALAVQACVLLTYVLGRRIVGERSAFWGALTLTLVPGFLGVGRLLVLDGVLTLWVTLAHYCAFIAAQGERLRWRWWIAAALCCGLGVLTKGPIAIILLIPPIWVHRWFTRVNSSVGAQCVAGAEALRSPGEPRVRGFDDSAPATPPCAIGMLGWLAFAAIVLAVALPWYIAVCCRLPQFARYFLWEHNVVRFVQPFDHDRPVWFYVPLLVIGFLPATLLLPALVRFCLTNRAETSGRRCPGMGFCLLAGGWCVLFFSMSGCKLPTYILPAFPPFALALGCFLARTPWRQSRWTWGLAGVWWCLMLASNLFLVPWYAEIKSPMNEPEEMRSFCQDRAVPVICFPRNVDSAAFYLGRSDFRTYRSKELGQLLEELDRNPRTVVLFGHRNSLKTLENRLPPHLCFVEANEMGLCDVAVIERRHSR